MKTDALFRTQVEVDGFVFTVSYRPDGIVIYKDVPSGVYFKRSWQWDSRRNPVPEVGSTIARVLSLADAKRPGREWPRYEFRPRSPRARDEAGLFKRIA